MGEPKGSFRVRFDFPKGKQQGGRVLGLGLAVSFKEQSIGMFKNSPV